MITLDQIRLLDEKVRKAVALINSLRNENGSLKARLEGYENRITELEKVIENFKSDQGQIEEGIQKALSQLEEIQSQQGAPTAPTPDKKASMPPAAAPVDNENASDKSQTGSDETENNVKPEKEEPLIPENIDDKAPEDISEKPQLDIF